MAWGPSLNVESSEGIAPSGSSPQGSSLVAVRNRRSSAQPFYLTSPNSDHSHGPSPLSTRRFSVPCGSPSPSWEHSGCPSFLRQTVSSQQKVEQESASPATLVADCAPRFKALRTTTLLRLGRLGDQFKELPLFKDCSLEFLDMLAENADTKCFEKGDVILRQGEFADTMYILLAGQCSVYVQGVAEPITEFSNGRVFGEMAAICRSQTAGRRTATIIATAFCECRVVTRDALNRVSSCFPNDDAVIKAEAMRRLAALQDQGRAADRGRWYQISSHKFGTVPEPPVEPRSARKGSKGSSSGRRRSATRDGNKCCPCALPSVECTDAALEMKDESIGWAMCTAGHPFIKRMTASEVSTAASSRVGTEVRLEAPSGRDTPEQASGLNTPDQKLMVDDAHCGVRDAAFTPDISLLFDACAPSTTPSPDIGTACADSAQRRARDSYASASALFHPLSVSRRADDLSPQHAAERAERAASRFSIRPGVDVQRLRKATVASRMKRLPEMRYA